MSNQKKSKPTLTVKHQEVCIDLPGESVQCWRSSDKVKVILRKHRDIIFDLNLKKDAVYTVESKDLFYNPREKKLSNSAVFSDGERFNIWVGRNFQDCILLKLHDMVIGRYEIKRLDATDYGSDPKTKPEPLMVIMGKKQEVEPFMCTANDPFGVGRMQISLAPTIESKLSFMKSAGSQFDYAYPKQPPEVCDYVAVTEVGSEAIQPTVLAQLENGSVTGKPADIFKPPAKSEEAKPVYQAINAAALVAGGSEAITSNWFKESAGYIQEHWKSLNKLSMTVRIEKKAIGKYRALIKGKPLSQLIAQSFGGNTVAQTKHYRNALGSAQTRFIDGGFAKSGKDGYGGARRIALTNYENFRSGLKIQIIGTIIDLFVDAHSVFLDEKGSRDLSEFLGRAGVSITKAGATAALGSVLAAAGTALVTAGALALGMTAAPVFAVVAVVVGGYILAATVVDYVDNKLEIKENVASMAR